MEDTGLAQYQIPPSVARISVESSSSSPARLEDPDSSNGSTTSNHSTSFGGESESSSKTRLTGVVSIYFSLFFYFATVFDKFIFIDVSPYPKGSGRNIVNGISDDGRNGKSDPECEIYYEFVWYLVQLGVRDWNDMGTAILPRLLREAVGKV